VLSAKRAKIPRRAEREEKIMVCAAASNNRSR
jgi:hypothetical protein